MLFLPPTNLTSFTLCEGLVVVEVFVGEVLVGEVLVGEVLAGEVFVGVVLVVVVVGLAVVEVVVFVDVVGKSSCNFITMSPRQHSEI